MTNPTTVLTCARIMASRCSRVGRRKLLHSGLDGVVWVTVPVIVGCLVCVLDTTFVSHKGHGLFICNLKYKDTCLMSFEFGTNNVWVKCYDTNHCGNGVP